MPNSEELQKIDYHLRELQSTISRMSTLQEEQGADIKEVKRDQRGHVDQYNIDKIENERYKAAMHTDIQIHELSLTATKRDVERVKGEVEGVKGEIGKLGKYVVFIGIIVTVAVLVGPENAKTLILQFFK